MVSPPGDTKRLFVGELNGKIKVIPDVTAAKSDLLAGDGPGRCRRDPTRAFRRRPCCPEPNTESGLLGFAMHPDFATNGYFYVSYVVAKASGPHGLVSAAVAVHGSRRADRPARSGGRSSLGAILIEQPDRQDSHNGSDLHFGADGYLYWSIGDEGYPNDHWKNSQRIDMNFFGAMLRIDVDKKPGNLEPNAHPNPAAARLGYSAMNAIPRDEIPAGSGIFKARYSIPVDNPFVAVSQGGTWDGTFNGSAVSAGKPPYVRSEFWAVGLRSPWRFTIDEPTGEIWLGDVGRGLLRGAQPHQKGENYGWAFREGRHPGPKTARRT